MTNKELIDKLEAYFLNQEPATVCRVLANMMIDMNRMCNISKLPMHERLSLFERCKLNDQQLSQFATSEQYDKPLTMGMLND